MWCDFNLEDYTGGSRVKNLHVKLRGANTFLSIIIVVINREFKRTLYISQVEKSK